MEVDWILAYWGAVVSTILAFIKIKDAWNNRFQIDIIAVFRDNADYGHEISIQNLSGKPVLLNDIELFYKNKGFWPFKKNIILWSPEDSLITSKIDPHSSKTLNFDRGDHFNWDGRAIYIRLYFAGNKVLVKKLCS